MLLSRKPPDHDTVLKAVTPIVADASAGSRRAGSSRRREILWILLVAAGLAGAFSYDRFIHQPHAARRAFDAMQVARVSRANLGASTQASGVVSAERKVNLSPNVASRISRLLIQEGDQVQEAQLVAVMESDEQQARVNQMRAKLEAARASSRAAGARRIRHESLLASGAISVDQMEELRNEELQAELSVKEAVFEVKAAEVELRNSMVVAPFSGIITRQFAQVGQFVTPTTTASEEDGAASTSIAELSSGLKVIARIPEAALTEISPGQEATIRTDAFPTEIFSGRVKMISPRAVTDNEVNSFPVEVEIITGLARLKPAMNVEVKFTAEPIRDALVIPLAALTQGKDGQKGVLRSDGEGQIEFVPVRIGRVSGENVQILEGLREGERVLISAPPKDLKIPGFQAG